jgi:hypothetical protein
MLTWQALFFELLPQPARDFKQVCSGMRRDGRLPTKYLYGFSPTWRATDSPGTLELSLHVVHRLPAAALPATGLETDFLDLL